MNPKHNAPQIVVEGNIGAGKSTFLALLKSQLDVEVIYEPTNKWQGDTDHPENNLLHLFYQDGKRWAYTFQSYAFITRIQAQLEQEKKTERSVPHIYERSVFCDRYCFAKNCYELGMMSTLEWNIYKEWFGWLVESYTTPPAGIIYLRTTPDICHERISKRARSEESDIPFSYLELLHKRHEEWLIEKHDVISTLEHVPVLVLNCNEEFESNKIIQQQHLEAVQHFLTRVKSSYQVSRPPLQPRTSDLL